MMLRATQAVYWPGFAKDIEQTHVCCGSCDKAAPSLSNLTLVQGDNVE